MSSTAEVYEIRAAAAQKAKGETLITAAESSVCKSTAADLKMDDWTLAVFSEDEETLARLSAGPWFEEGKLAPLAL